MIKVNINLEVHLSTMYIVMELLPSLGMKKMCSLLCLLNKLLFFKFTKMIAYCCDCTFGTNTAIRLSISCLLMPNYSNILSAITSRIHFLCIYNCHIFKYIIVYTLQKAGLIQLKNYLIKSK